MSNFSPHFLEEIRTRTTLSEWVGKRVKLIRKGREFSGLCPFHNEKTPSFTVNDDKAFYHCFGCGAHGDVIRYLVEAENFTFPEAVVELASRAGLDVPDYDPVQEREKTDKTEILHKIMEEATQWFQGQLNLAPAASVRDYLNKRGIFKGPVEDFRLGYASPVGEGIKQALISRGFKEDQLIQAGLLIKPEDGRPSFDRFRGRLMFPIADAKGRVVAFGGRQMSEGHQGAKYLNSPETPVFHKGSTLYGYDHARTHLKKGGDLVVVEGYMDVIALRKAGLLGVAPLGTALTEDQIRLLWRMAPDPILCFDGDQAGQRAGLRAAERVLPLLKPGYSLQFVFMPAGQDPDDLVRKGEEKTLYGLLKSPRSLLDTLWAQGASMAAETPEQKAQIQKQFYEWADQIKDETIKALYLSEWKDRFYQTFVAKKKTGRVDFPRAPRVVRKRPNFSEMYEQIALVTLINHPHMIHEVSDHLVGIDFQDERMGALCEALLFWYGQENEINRERLIESLQEEGYREVLHMIMSPQTLLHAAFAREGSTLDQAREGWHEIYDRMMSYQGLKQACQQVRGELAVDMTPANWDRLKRLKALQNGK